MLFRRKKHVLMVCPKTGKIFKSNMFKKMVLLVSLVVLLLLSAGGNISRADYAAWYNDDGNNCWSDPNNWHVYIDANNFSHRLPGLPYDDAVIIQPGFSGMSGPVFNANDGIQTPYFIIVGSLGYDSPVWRWCRGEMTMSGGTIRAPWGFTFNKWGDANSNSTMYMGGGLLHIGPWPGYAGLSEGFLGIGRAGTATFNMTGGMIECVSFEIPENITSGANGTFNLDGGVVNSGSLWIAVNGVGGETKTGRLNIIKGKLILPDDKRVAVNGYVSSGLICPYPGQTGRRIVNVDFDSYTPGKTTVTASKTELTQAYKPVPMDTHPNVEKSATLSWSPGDGAVSHKLYLGVDFNDVNDGAVEAVIPDNNNFTPNTFVCGQKYYWRVDECNDTNTYKGQVWSFTVAYNPKASAPSPANGVTGVDPNVNLAWTAGDTAIAHDVYFGTSFADVNSATNPNTPPGRGRQAACSYEPNTLVLGQSYYWRIDEYDGDSVHKGDIWSFEVISNFACEPRPFDGKRYVAPDVVLSWSPGYGAVSHDVYFGTNSSDVNDAIVPLATVGTNSYTPEGLELGQTYYWRIDEDNNSTTYKGTVWSFTTEPVGSVRAFPGAEGYGAYSVGGRGGDVYHVTNLTDDATNPEPNSLRYGINTATGPRTIVFDVSGYIDLQNRLEITKSYITIAGQTAPGEGITLRKHDIRIYNTNNVIIRFIRVRVGYYESGQYENQFGGLDALSIEKSTDIIIDHVSTSWGVDELMSVTSDSNDITVQWCTLTEPLNVNGHSKASLLRPAMTSRLTHHHNLYADIMMRVTRFGNYNDDVTTRFDWYNNVVFNWGSQSTYSSNDLQLWDYVNRRDGDNGADSEFVEINFLDNYFITGPSTSSPSAYQGSNAANHRIWAAGIFMDSDNDAQRNGTDKGWDAIGGSYMKMTGPFSIESPYTWEDAETAYEKVLGQAGASFVRDAVDKRIVSQVKACIGSVPITQDDVGGWPAITEVHRLADFDTDNDGMPDAWETARGLNPNDANDGASDSGDGYTNLEKYLNYLTSRGGTGDFDKDGDIGLDDLSILTSHWLDNDCNNVPVGNLDYDCDVDFNDFAIFAKEWLDGL